MTRRPNYQRPRRPCACCGKVGPIHGNGYRAACYLRWVAAGRPPSGPPAPKTTGGKRPRGERESFIEDYALLRRTRGLSLFEAAEALGVSVRTAQRYNAELRTQSAR